MFSGFNKQAAKQMKLQNSLKKWKGSFLQINKFTSNVHYTKVFLCKVSNAVLNNLDTCLYTISPYKIVNISVWLEPWVKPWVKLDHSFFSSFHLEEKNWNYNKFERFYKFSFFMGHPVFFKRPVSLLKVFIFNQ